jgi:hypothetical protein
LEILSFYLHF